MTVSRPEGHPTDDELRAWRNWSAQGSLNGRGDLVYDIDRWMVRVCDALLGERAAHAIDEKALRLAARAIDGFREHEKQLESELAVERAAHTATKAALRELVEASEAFSLTPDVKAIDWDVVGPWILALQSARGVSGEFGESSE